LDGQFSVLWKNLGFATAQNASANELLQIQVHMWTLIASKHPEQIPNFPLIPKVAQNWNQHSLARLLIPKHSDIVDILKRIFDLGLPAHEYGCHFVKQVWKNSTSGKEILHVLFHNAAASDLDIWGLVIQLDSCQATVAEGSVKDLPRVKHSIERNSNLTSRLHSMRKVPQYYEKSQINKARIRIAFFNGVFSSVISESSILGKTWAPPIRAVAMERSPMTPIDVVYRDFLNTSTSEQVQQPLMHVTSSAAPPINQEAVDLSTVGVEEAQISKAAVEMSNDAKQVTVKSASINSLDILGEFRQMASSMELMRVETQSMNQLQLTF